MVTCAPVWTHRAAAAPRPSAPRATPRSRPLFPPGGGEDPDPSFGGDQEENRGNLLQRVAVLPPPRCFGDVAGRLSPLHDLHLAAGKILLPGPRRRAEVFLTLRKSSR